MFAVVSCYKLLLRTNCARRASDFCRVQADLRNCALCVHDSFAVSRLVGACPLRVLLSPARVIMYLECLSCAVPVSGPLSALHSTLHSYIQQASPYMTPARPLRIRRTAFECRTAEMSLAEACPAVRGSGTLRQVMKHRPHEPRAAREARGDGRTGVPKCCNRV